MPRRPRVFAEGLTYHVYNHVARGERPFAADREAERLVACLREVRKRDGLTVLAWCVMPGHYHLLLRAGEVPLWRSMHYAQHQYSVEANRRHGVAGPVWQSRYKAKAVEHQEYLDRLIGYIHLNPVAAGLVRDPARYRWSGHIELLGRRQDPLADVAAALALIDPDADGAVRSYLSMLKGMRGEAWLGEPPEKLPWWRPGAGGPPAAAASAARAKTGPKPLVDRPRAPLRALIAHCSDELGVAEAEITSRLRSPEALRARQAIAALLVERWGVRVSELAEALGRTRDGTSHLLGSAVRRRAAEAAFADLVDELDRKLASRLGAGAP